MSASRFIPTEPALLKCKSDAAYFSHYTLEIARTLKRGTEQAALRASLQALQKPSTLFPDEAHSGHVWTFAGWKKAETKNQLKLTVAIHFVNLILV
jgi:hypothetical protein